MQSSAIRTKFLEYFKKNGHTIIPSSSLVPVNDPTLLFTNAGMVQFKDVFLGKEQRRDKNGEIVTRAVTCQRCLRAGGKHNDLENVGYTTRHHTFFEMLGNFSFGDYFKKEAIHYAWDFLTNELGIPSEKLLITVHEKDTEAAQLWAEEFKKSGKFPQGGIEEGIIRCGDKDNFWAMGETGPCGYCSEIFYDHDFDESKKLPGGKPGAHDEGGERYVEIWNLVFMQFERDNKGNLTPLPKPSVDTGMGLERIAAVMQGKYDNYTTDDFTTLSQEVDHLIKQEKDSINELSQYDFHSTEEHKNELKIAGRVIADHVRAIVFLIKDNVSPSNERRGYVLRSIMRRAIYHLYIVGAYANKELSVWLPRLAGIFIDGIGIENIYPELQFETDQKKYIALKPLMKIIGDEERQFLETLSNGVKILDKEINKLKSKILPGTIVFRLHDTFGFPAVLTEEIAKKHGLTIDQAGFEEEMEKQRERSRAASKFGTKGELKLSLDGATEFVGYETTFCEAKIRALFDLDGLPIEYLQTDEEGIIVLDKTPFYAESGGQVGDIGYLSTKERFQFQVLDTKKYGALYLHKGIVKCGSFTKDTLVEAKVDEANRTAIKLNHSSAHLLHKALQEVLGDHATQRGSLVDAKKLRFDFAHFSALTTEELHTIANIVNAQIRANLTVKTTIMSLEEAKKAGAVALFGEKYGDKVRVVKMGDFSSELCGGTHVNQTGEIGILQVVSESGVAAGIRRIEAVTGANALEWVTQNTTELKKAAELLNTNIDQVCVKLQHGFTEKRALEKELTQIKSELANNKGKDLVTQAKQVGGINVLAAKIENANSKTLRQTLDTLKEKLQPAVVLLATVNADKIQLVVGVSKDICEKFKANELLQYVAKQVDGTGGGRPDMAQGGGTNIANLDVALQSVTGYVNKIAI